METKTESPELIASLSTLSEFFTQNTPTERRRLRSTTEREFLKINDHFLAVTGSVLSSLNLVEDELNDIASACEEMNVSLRTNKERTSDLLSETEKLQHALESTETRQKLAGKFLEQYQLQPEELKALHSDVLNEKFFVALEHVRKIHSNCKSLLQTHHQRAGLELMDSMSTLQESAYERLCRWVQNECRALGEMDAPEVNPLLQKAVGALRDREVLYRYCAEEVSSARHAALFQRFIKALTRGQRPIEMHAPDARRYVSDMLAWLHTSLASEKEFLASLFGNEDEISQEAISTIPRMLDSIFESICRPLKVRIEQVLMSSPKPMLCFRLSQLLTFYLKIVDSMLGESNQLSEALRSCRTMAMRIFHEQIKQRGDKLSRYPPAPPRDLSVPPQLMEGIVQVTELIECYEANYDSEQAGCPDFEASLSALVTPLVEVSDRSSEALNPTSSSRLDEGSHLDPSDQSIYVINCLYALHTPLVGHACAAERAKQLDDLMNSKLLSLVETEVQKMLASYGMQEIIERIELYQRGQRYAEAQMAADPYLGLAEIAGAMRTFFGKLSDPSTLPEYAKLQAPRYRMKAAELSLRYLSSAYAKVYDALMDSQNGYSRGEVLEALKHTPTQVNTLLGVL